MASFSMIKKDHQFHVHDSDGIELADIHALQATHFEKGHAFVYTSRTDDQSIHVGIQKGRLIFADYLLQVADQTFSLQDHKGKSLLYFAVSGVINGKNIYIEEDWDGHIELKVEKEKIGLIKPYTIRKGAKIDIFNEADQDFYLPILSLFYFMFQIYKKESEFVEDLIEEALDL